MTGTPIRILFVCLGNICRSPLAEGVARQMIRERGLEEWIEVDSAGTGAWHVGEAPDHRMSLVAEENGVSLNGQTARRLDPEDLQRFTHVYGMDRSNLADIKRLATRYGATARIGLFREHDPDPGDGDVPDPYYGGAGAFQLVYDLVQRTTERIIDDLLSDAAASRGEG
jgi:protein-tyrosine phosphatase